MNEKRASTLVRPVLDTFDAYSPGKSPERLECELKRPIVNLASNEGLFGPVEEALDALTRTATDLNRYPDGGAYLLHDALVDRHKLSPKEVVVGAGADGCIDMLSQATLGPGDEIVCGWPTFPSFVVYARKQGAEVRLVPLVKHRYDLNGLLSAVTRRTKLVYVCHPNNPTGTMNTTDELDAYFERVPDHVLTVIDQAYFEYIDRVDYPDAIERYFKRGRRVVVLRTFSKMYGLAGLRVGYAVAPESLSAALLKVRRPYDIATPAQVAALASVSQDVEVARRRTISGEYREALENALRNAQLKPVPSVTNFVYVDFNGDALAVSTRLLREGVLVRPLGAFGAPSAVRITVGHHDEIEKLAHAIGRARTG